MPGTILAGVVLFLFVIGAVTGDGGAGFVAMLAILLLVVVVVGLVYFVGLSVLGGWIGYYMNDDV